MKLHARQIWLVFNCAVMASCMNSERVRAPGEITPDEARARVAKLLPPNVTDRAGWSADIYAAFAALKIMSSAQNICAVLAVTEQESGFQVNPKVPNLPAIAWREIDARAERAGIPKLVAHAALELSSPSGKTYRERVDAASTEKDLSDLFEDFIGMVPMGKRLFSGWNPVRTAGPMQVSIAYAEKHASEKKYPYSIDESLRKELFTRRGGMYFGIAHLLDYSVDYPELVYRFADYNAGHYASRNAAFQNALSVASGKALSLDGDLVSYSGASSVSRTELASRSIGNRLDLSDAAIHRDLESGESERFADSTLYRRVFALAEKNRARPLPRAVLPKIQLRSEKITRSLTTEWFARRVDARYQRCLARGAQPS